MQPITITGDTLDEVRDKATEEIAAQERLGYHMARCFVEKVGEKRQITLQFTRKTLD